MHYVVAQLLFISVIYITEICAR